MFFLSANFDTPDNFDATITKDEFFSYYAGVSASINKDEDFLMMVNDTYRLFTTKPNTGIRYAIRHQITQIQNSFLNSEKTTRVYFLPFSKTSRDYYRLFFSAKLSKVSKKESEAKIPKFIEV